MPLRYVDEDFMKRHHESVLEVLAVLDFVAEMLAIVTYADAYDAGYAHGSTVWG